MIIRSWRVRCPYGISGTTTRLRRTFHQPDSIRVVNCFRFANQSTSKLSQRDGGPLAGFRLDHPHSEPNRRHHTTISKLPLQDQLEKVATETKGTPSQFEPHHKLIRHSQSLRKSRRSRRTVKESEFNVNGIVRPFRRTQRTSRLPWREQRYQRQVEHARASQTIRWKTFTFKRSPLRTQARKMYDTRIWPLVAKSARCWSPDVELIQKAFRENTPHVTTRLMKFQRYLSRIGKFDQNDVFRAWLQLSWRGKVIWWRHALYCAILWSPLDGLNIISDISRRSYLQIPDTILADALLLVHVRFLVEHIYDRHTEDEYQTQIRALFKTSCEYLAYQTKRTGSASLPRPIIWVLSQRLEGWENLVQLKKSLMASGDKMSVYSKLRLMSSLVGVNCLEEAMDLFLTLNEDELLNRGTQIFCVTVLRVPWEVDDLYAFRRRLTSWFLDNGVQPDSQLRNAIMQNYLESGDWQSAWQMLLTIRKRRLRVDQTTYSIFLTHLPVEDTATTQTLYKWAKEDRVLYWEPWLPGQFIQVAASAKYAAAEPAFHTLLGLYEKMFDTSDLVDFGLLDDSQLNWISRKPSPFTVKWMLMSWIRDNKHDPERLIAAYNNYLYHLHNNHPRISPLAQDTHVPTSFVLAFGQHKAYLHMCTKVLEDMIRPQLSAPPQDITPANTETEDNVPEYEKFLEPEQPENPIPALKPLWSKSSNNETEQIPEYEKFLEPEEPEEQEPEEQEPEEQESSLASENVEHLTTLMGGMEYRPYTYKVAPPDKYVWTTLLSVLINHKELEAAENVFKTMLVSQSEPDDVTWMILEKAHARNFRPPISLKSHRKDQDVSIDDLEMALASMELEEMRAKDSPVESRYSDS